jgi:ADP-ribose pyrophosphatase YjhB (NUDIX family)
MPEYNNPKPVAVALVPMTDGPVPSLLGVARGNEPGRGGIALPGGYVDALETFEEACTRELKEECGMVTDPDDWELVCSRKTATNRVLVFCRLKPHVEQIPRKLSDLVLPVSEEVLALASIDEATDVVFPTHQEVARKFLAGQRP